MSYLLDKLQSKYVASFAANLAEYLKDKNPKISQEIETYAQQLKEFHANTIISLTAPPQFIRPPQPTREVAHVLRLYLRLNLHQRI